MGAFSHVFPSVETRSSGETCASAAHWRSCWNAMGPNSDPSCDFRRYHFVSSILLPFFLLGLCGGFGFWWESDLLADLQLLWIGDFIQLHQFGNRRAVRFRNLIERIALHDDVNVRAFG